MAGADLEEKVRRSGMNRYLLADEKIVVADRLHWAKVAVPFATGLAALVVAIIAVILIVAADSPIPPSASALSGLLLLGCAVLFVRGAWKVADWRNDLFVATDKRMLVNFGLINRGVAMLTLARVIDLTYTRSWLGQLLGYGTLLRESAGPKQTLHKVDWVRDPDRTYRTICGGVFGLPEDKRGTRRNDQGAESVPPAKTPRLTPNQQSPLQQIPIQQTYSPYAGFPPASTEPDTIDESARIRTLPAELQPAELQPAELQPAELQPAELQPDDTDSWRPDTTMDDSVPDVDDDTTT